MIKQSLSVLKSRPSCFYQKWISAVRFYQRQLSFYTKQIPVGAHDQAQYPEKWTAFLQNKIPTVNICYARQRPRETVDNRTGCLKSRPSCFYQKWISAVRFDQRQLALLLPKQISVGAHDQ